MRLETASLLVVADSLASHEQLRLFLERFPGKVHHVQHPQDVKESPDEYDAVIIVQPETEDSKQATTPWPALRTILDQRKVGVLLVGGAPPDGGLLTGWASHRASAEELYGRIETMMRYRAILQGTDRELARLQKLRDQLNRHFEELDQEMRLASRLQRDFLPRETPQLGPLRFATVYQPASWVSGDIYDVFRLDEKNVGFYLADAVGHGVAAGLLTMFIKQAMLTKVIDEGQYRLVPPHEALAALNDALASQELPNCQFATACYGVVNAETLELTVARGGHPYPLHVRADGTVAEIESEGGLLGVFAKAEFPSAKVQLKPGEKIVVYSDGLEGLIIAGRDDVTRRPRYTPQFAEQVRLPCCEMAAELRERINSHEGSLTPADDMTAVVLEVAVDRT
jgi:serine phosphatase RsbU (regulator of sigma subunit)